jgi:Tol biopolymer transport system component
VNRPLDRRLTIGLAAALVLAVAAAVAAIAWNERGSAARSTANGRIAFTAPGKHLRTAADLYTIDADGSDRRLVSACPVGSGDARWLNFPFGCTIRVFAWSPDGKRLALLRGRQGGSTLSTDMSLFVLDADGERERRLPGCGGPRWLGCGDDFGSPPAWAPDGSRLIVTRSGRLLLFDVDRGRYRRLTHGCRPRVCYDVDPAWAPDGSRIVFARTEGPRSRSLYSMKSDGSEVKRLTRLPGWVADPAWSPDGRRIAFERWSERAKIQIYSIAPDGSALTVLDEPPHQIGSRLPAWSPDGRQIAYVRTPEAAVVGTRRAYVGPVGAPIIRAEVWVMDADGSGRKRLYRSSREFAQVTRPQWSPDGKFIAFTLAMFDEEGLAGGIFVVKRDGTGLQRVTDISPQTAWQPIS